MFIDQCMHKDHAKQSIKAIVVNNEPIGSVGLMVQDDVSCKTAELGYWLGEPFWNKGIMTKAIIQTCENGFANFDVFRIYARPFVDNIGSRKALEKAGFELEGICKKAVFKNGKITDYCMYALIK